MKRNYLFSIMLLILLFTAVWLPALDVIVDSGFSTSYEQVPFLLSANTWGDVYNDKNFQGYLGTRIKHDIPFFNDSLQFSIVADGAIRISDEPDINPREVYGKFSFGDFFLVGGLLRSTVGDTPLPDLTLGSMAVSANAPPVPKLTFASDGYFSLPFTNETLWIKGGISQGVFLDDRYVDNLYLHEKWGYLKFQKEDAFSFHLGLVHEAIWDGAASGGNFVWGDLISAFLGMDGGAEADGSTVAGDALGIYDIGSTMIFDTYSLHLYKHHFFEDGSGLKLQNIGDGLWGLGLEFNKKELFSNFVFEFLNTVDQSGSYHNVILQDGSNLILGGLDNYYSHNLYRSGWTNYGFSLGTPFILTSGDGTSTRIASNRVRAFILGVQGFIAGNRYLVKTAYATHYYPYTAGDADEIVSSEGDSISFLHMLFEYSIDDFAGKEGIGVTFQGAFDIDSLGGFYPGALVVVKYKYY